MVNLRESPHLPLLIGVCATEEPFCLITQFGDKWTMFSALRCKRLLGAVPWADVIRQVILALKTIHKSHFIHNDLKGKINKSPTSLSFEGIHPG